jgi:16S rRNA (guanine966-N2)-methyltransferase
MVEQDREAVAELRRSMALIGSTRIELVPGDALAYLGRAGERFDVVFLDPPFRQNAAATALELLPPRLAPGARVYVEADAPIEAGTGWRELKRARAGQVSYQLLEWRSDDQGGLSGNV